jgi:endonuclease-3
LKTKNTINKILRQLAAMYPDAGCGLDFASPWQLLVATILSAQCTDQRVNQVTPSLFARYKDPDATLKASEAELEEIIRPTGFFRNKAKSIKGSARMLAEKHNGQTPSSLDELVQLPGVGRKTANVVLGDAFGIPGITVDTHLGRVCRRLGLTAENDPDKAERDLMKIIPRKDWTIFSHQAISHGRAICQARKARCPRCGLAAWCDFALNATV